MNNFFKFNLFIISRLYGDFSVKHNVYLVRKDIIIFNIFKNGGVYFVFFLFIFAPLIKNWNILLSSTNKKVADRFDPINN